jgi:hypothetical protein
VKQKTLVCGTPLWRLAVAGLQWSSAAAVIPLAAEAAQTADAPLADDAATDSAQHPASGESQPEAPLSAMMRMKGRGPQLLAAERTAELLGDTELKLFDRQTTTRLLRSCRNSSGRWSQITPAELAALPRLVSILEVQGGEEWRPIVSNGQTVTFWLMLMHGDVRWRLPNESDPGNATPLQVGAVARCCLSRWVRTQSGYERSSMCALRRAPLRSC